VFRSQKNTPDETNGINNAVSCYKEAVQFSASSATSVTVCQFLKKFVELILYFFWVTLIKIANTQLGRSAALVLSIFY